MQACGCIPDYPETQAYVAKILGILGCASEITGAASPQAMQQLGNDRALLVAGSLQPAVVGLLPYWRNRELVQRAH